MSPTFLPGIRKADYPRFQEIIPELQKTLYSEWTEDLRKAAAYRRKRNGSTVVPVSPDGFVAWLQAASMIAHLETLWTYAEEQAAHLFRSVTEPHDHAPGQRDEVTLAA